MVGSAFYFFEKVFFWDTLLENVHKSSDMEGRATQNLKCLQILEILEVASRWGGFGERMLTLGNRTNRHLPQSPEKEKVARSEIIVTRTTEQRYHLNVSHQCSC